ncbi:uncharacterized protein LOC135462880 [Liolophura sinensis]|uniref:uncharacterized protein LOC135462880 n=1 Tax=Liolophura sinensis TaxID=3198878 RepID=UPI0031590DBB
MLPYAVVMFVVSRTVAVISTAWFTSDEEDECYWPPASNSAKVKKMLQTGAVPTQSWKKFNIRVLGKAADLTKAEFKLRRSEFTSDLQTETEEEGPSTSKRRPKPNQWYLDSDWEPQAAVVSDLSDSDSESIDQALILPPPAPSMADTPITPPPPSAATPERRPATLPSAVSISGLSQEIHHLKKVVLKSVGLLEKVLENQRILQSVMESILRKDHGQVQDRELPEGVTFPLKTMEDFDALDALLMESSVLNRVASHSMNVGKFCSQVVVYRRNNIVS